MLVTLFDKALQIASVTIAPKVSIPAVQEKQWLQILTFFQKIWCLEEARGRLTLQGREHLQRWKDSCQSSLLIHSLVSQYFGSVWERIILNGTFPFKSILYNTTFSKPMWHFFWNQYKTLKNQCDNLNLNVTMAHGPCLTQSLFLYFLIRHYSVSAIFDLEYY